MQRTLELAVVFTAAMLWSTSALAQQGDLTHQHPATAEAAVDFGVLPTAPLGPPPCLQSGAIGGPADPCAYKIHVLTPEEVTIVKDGQVGFQIHGGGHGLAIYEVSKDTTREQIGQYLCAGIDPKLIDDPLNHLCNLSVVNAAAARLVLDGHDAIAIAVAPNVTNAFPDNRVYDATRQLMSAGAIQFLNGGTIPAGPTSNGQLITYKFQKTGRYLVICMNRVHSLNDWMFGFVNVVGD